jgi:uncharacterized membrane protein
LVTLRKYLIAGILVWFPLAATFALVRLVIELLDGTILLLPPEYRPEALFGFYIPGFGVILALCVLIITGALAANIIGRRMVDLWESILNRIPLVRNIYNSIKQITATVLTSQGKSFRKVLLVEYPRRDTWSIGFLTNESIDIDMTKMTEEVCAVFVPTTPNPTSGFIIMVPKKDVIELDLSIEEGFKYVISMGVIVPERTMKESFHVDSVAN